MKLTRKSCLAVLFVMIWVLLSTCLTILFVVPFAYAQETQTVLKPNQLFTFTLAPKQEKLFVLQMKQGEIADIQWLEAEGSYCAYEIYDPARKELLEKSIASEESMWFVAPSDGDFVLVSKLGWEFDNSSSHKISLQYNNKFKLPPGMKLEETKRVNGYDVKIMGTSKSSRSDSGDSILLVEKNGRLLKVMKYSAHGSGLISFGDDSAQLTRELKTARDKGYRSSLIARLKNLQLINSTPDRTGNGVPDIMISRPSGRRFPEFDHFLIKLGGNFNIIEAPSAAFGKNPKGGLFFESSEDEFDKWFTPGMTCCGRSCNTTVILEFKDGKWRPNIDLMKKPAPSLAVLRSRVQQSRPRLSLKAYRGAKDLNALSDDPGLLSKEYSEDYNYHEPSSYVRPFWCEMIELIYTGNEEMAWQFLDWLWPPQKQGKELFIRDFKNQLSQSRYWQMILEDKTK